MKKKLFFLAFLFITIMVKGQVFDTCIMRYKYVFSYQVDSLDTDTKRTDIMVLAIGNRTSVYYSKDAKIGDSLADADIKKGLSLNEMAANRGKYKIGKSRTMITKNYPENIITVTDHLVMDNYKYTEPLTGQQWKILKDTATLYGLQCQKAITTFRGRDFEAWFTKDIPVANGPWKFYGLPGLIVKVNDTKQQFSFEFNGIELPGKNEQMEVGQKKYILVSRKKLWNLKKEMCQHPLEFAMNRFNAMEIKADGQPIPQSNLTDIPIPFNPIELE